MRFGTIDMNYAADLATRSPENDGPIYMVNFMKYKSVAEYREGSDAEGGISGKEADDKYAPVAQHLPVGVPCDLQVLAGAPSQVHEGVVEAARLEEGRHHFRP